MPAGIQADVGGRIPFSLVAVIALLLAGVSSAYLAATSRDAEQARLQEQQLLALQAVAAGVHRGVELETHALALEAIRITSESPAGGDRTNREFARLLQERLARSFPRTIRGFTVELGSISAALFLQRLQTRDLIPAPAAAEEVANWTSETLSPERPAVLAESSRAPYFTLVGTVNYTVLREGTSLQMTLPLRTTINSPFPLLQSAAREFRGGADGSESEVARIVRYVLTTAAQFRVLEGYGAGAFGEPGTTTADILSPKDVEVAVNLALLLEELRRFRDFDEGAATAFDAAFFGGLAGRYVGDPRVPDASERTIRHLLEAYAKGGTADPADLFALFAAFDADPLRLNRVLAQALTAVLDQQVLRVFEYYGIEGALDLGVQGAELLARSIDDFLTWVDGGRREADLVRGFVGELFGMAGEPATFLGPFTLAMPDREYRAVNGDGASFGISVPAHAAVIGFDVIELLAGRDALWRAYYDPLYKAGLRAVHASAREFLTDLATHVANDLNLIGAIPNPTLRGHLDPKDSDSILDFVRSSLTTAIDGAIHRLRTDPSYLGSLVANLWKAQADSVRGLIDFLQANYDALVDRDLVTLRARFRLALDLGTLASSDPDYAALDATGVADLQAQIFADANGPWIPVAYSGAKDRDSVRLERIYTAATAASTPPERGGIYQRLLDTVVGATGFLERAGGLMRAHGRALASSEDLQNMVLQVPTPEGPFEFWTGDRSVAAATNAIRSEDIVVRQTPAILRITHLGGSSAWDPAGPRPGDLWVDLRDPSTVPPGRTSANVHWTDIHAMSERPFETRWDLRIAGLLQVGAESARGVRVGPSGHIPEVASVDVAIDFSLAITVYSGWPLAGVEYKASSTFVGEVWARILRVLGEFWERLLAPMVDRLLDMVHGFIEDLTDLVRRMMETEVVRALGEVVRVSVDVLQDFVLRMLAPSVPAVEALVLTVKDGNLAFEVLGMTVTLGPGPTPMSVQLAVARADARIWAALIVQGFDRNEPLSPKNSPIDLRFGFTYYADRFSLTLEGDILAIIDGRLITARGIPKDGGWALELEVPAIDSDRVETPWALTLPPIPTPVGTLTIELGVDVRYRVHSSVDWAEILASAVAAAWREVGGLPTTWEDVKTFMEALTKRLIRNLEDLLVSGLVELREFVLYLEGVVGAGDMAGGGFRVAFVMDGEALIKVLRWLVHNLFAFLGTFPNLGAGVEYDAFPSDLLDSFSVRIEAFATVGLPHFMSVAGGEVVPTRVRMDVRIQPNVPAIVNLWQPDAGAWRVDFGLYLERVPAPVADIFFHTGKATPDVWFLKGAFFETTP